MFLLTPKLAPRNSLTPVDHDPRFSYYPMQYNLTAQLSREDLEKPRKPRNMQTAILHAVSQMRTSTATGPANWRLLELRSLPKQAWIEFSFLVHLFEHEHFPVALQEVWISLIPKGTALGLPAPGDLRPIAVTSTLYRVYSKAKAAALGPRVEAFLHSCQCHPLLFLAPNGADLAWISASASTSAAIASVLEIGGVDSWNADLVQRIVRSIRRRWRLPGRNLSEVLRVSRGIPQGCCISVLVANCFLALLTKELMRGFDRDTVRVSTYCDDVLVIAQSLETLEILWQRVLDYVNTFGVRLNHKQSFAFSTSAEVCAMWKQSKAVGDLAVKNTFVYLGVILDMGHDFDQKIYEEYEATRVAKARRRLHRIQALPLPLERRAIVTAATVLPSMLFAPFSIKSSQEDMNGWRTSVIKAMQGGIQCKQRAAREILLYTFCKGHRVDPVGAQAESAIKWLAYLMQENWPVVREVIALKTPGIINSLMRMLEELGLEFVGDFTWKGASGAVLPLRRLLVTQAREKVWHDWRQLLRDHLYTLLEQRRPRFQGICRMDRTASLRFYHRLTSAADKGIFRLMTADGSLTPVQLYKRRSKPCATCARLLKTRYMYIGIAHVGTICAIMDHGDETIDQYAAATIACGLLPAHPSRTEVEIQAQLFQISKEYVVWRASEGLWPDKAGDRPHAAKAPRVPRLRCQQKISLLHVVTLPPRPHVGAWTWRGHEGDCRRVGGQWKAYCTICMACRNWALQ